MITSPSPYRPFRIPTILGLLLVVILVSTVIALFEWYGRKPSSASESIVPADVIVSNISDTGFTIVWTTSNPATGNVTLLTPKHTPSTYFDDRDTTGKMKAYVTHSVTVRSLSPSTSYTFRILSNGKSYTEGDKPYAATTATTISGGGTLLEPAYGTINDEGGLPVAGAVILLTIEQGQLLSTVTSPSGSWLLSLGFARNASLTKYLNGEGRLTETIRALSNNQEASAITDTLNDSPVPTMTLGKTYDFRKQQATGGKNTPLTDNTKETPSVLGDTTTTKPSTVKIVSLSSPAKNAALTSALPLITGTGIPGKTVSVVMGITNPTSGTTTVANDGIWRYTPAKSLGAGKQSVTITSVDVRGKPVAITHTFTILKSGTQVLGDATPSASLTPTFTPAPTATTEASASATPTPQLEGQPVPTSGTSLPTLLILVIGAGFLTSGLIFFFL
ncbi:MAG: Ig-like domain-containing protein [Patescibacteria group bacterium]